MSSLEVPSYFFHECESAIKVRGNNTSKEQNASSLREHKERERRKEGGRERTKNIRRVNNKNMAKTKREGN